MIRTPRKRTQRLYIKADARASFASVQKALDAASSVEIESPVLLVSAAHFVKARDDSRARRAGGFARTGVARWQGGNRRAVAQLGASAPVAEGQR